MYSSLKIWTGIKLTFLLIITGTVINYVLEHNARAKSKQLADPLAHVQLRIPDPAGVVQASILGPVDFEDRAVTGKSVPQRALAVHNPQRNASGQTFPGVYGLSDLGLQTEW